MESSFGVKIIFFVWLCSSCFSQKTIYPNYRSNETKLLNETGSGREKNASHVHSEIKKALEGAVQDASDTERSLYQEEVVKIMSHTKEEEKEGTKYKVKFILKSDFSHRTYNSSTCTSCKSAQLSGQFGPFTAFLEEPLVPGEIVAISGFIPKGSPQFLFSIRDSLHQHLLLDLTFGKTKRSVAVSVFYKFFYSRRYFHDQEFHTGNILDLVVRCQDKFFEIFINGSKYTHHTSSDRYDTSTHIYGYGMVGVTFTNGLRQLIQPKLLDPPLVAPFSVPILGLPMKPYQRTIGVGGIIPSNSNGFAVTLQTGPELENLRSRLSNLWVGMNDGFVAWNYYFKKWGVQQNFRLDRHLWSRGGQFYLEMVFREKSLVIFFNGVYGLEFNYETPLEEVNYLRVSEGLHVNILHGLQGEQECSAEVWSNPQKEELLVKDMRCSENRSYHNF